MRRVRLTQTLIQKAGPREARYTLYDETPGLMLRVEPSGNKLYYIDFTKDGKRSSKKLGNADILTVAQAREAAKEFLARVALGEDVAKKKSGPTLGEYLEGHYFPWVLANRKDGSGSVGRIKAQFVSLWDTRIKDIPPSDIEHWRVTRIRDVKAATVNKDLIALKAAINWGVKRGIIDGNPLARLERLQERDSQTKVRFLSPDERERLMAALDARETAMKAARENHNKWLDEREKGLMPELANHIKPMVIISLNTGIRRGALFSLLWSDVDLDKKILTLRGEDAKSGKTNYVPLNAAALSAFKEWQQKNKGDGLVFPSPKTGRRMDNCKTAWKNLMKAANIENFRWHDMRHDFASQLVMKGVDLNTVRELMGHSDIKMTLRYAHLAPEMKARAVAALE